MKFDIFIVFLFSIKMIISGIVSLSTFASPLFRMQCFAINIM